MSRDGSGNYSAPVNSWNPATNGAPATAADWTSLLSDIVAALTQSLSKDGQTVPTANLPMGNNKITGLASGTASSDAATKGQLDSLDSTGVSTFAKTVLDDADAAAMRTTLGVSSSSEVWQPGDVKVTAVSVAPSGWLACDGTAVSRATYAALFAAIGTAFGVGDGSTTFNLPDARNRMIVGSGSLYALGASGGSKDAVAVSHTHTASSSVTDPGHSHSLNGQTVQGNVSQSPSALTDAASRPLGTVTVSATTGISVSTTVNSGGVSGTNANMPPYVALLTIIKT